MVERLEIETGHRALSADDDIAILIGPDRRPVPRDSGYLEHQRLQGRIFLAKLDLKLARSSARGLGLGSKRGLVFGRGILEARTNCVAAGAQRLDFGPERPRLAVKREQCTEVELHPLGRNRLFNRGPLGLDEIDIQHRAALR